MGVGATQGEIDRGDRITMRVIGVIAALLGLALAAGQFTVAATYLWSPRVAVTLLADRDLPVTPGDGVVAAGVETVTVQTDHLAASARIMLAGGSVVLGITAVLVGAALAWLLIATAGGRTFRPTLRRFSTIAGCALLFGPMLGTSLSGFGQLEAALELNPAVDDILIAGFEFSAWGIALPIVGLGVICLGYLFQRIERLERDTEGLV